MCNLDIDHSIQATHFFHKIIPYFDYNVLFSDLWNSSGEG